MFRYGAIFGLGGRIIAPPLEELSLVGPMLKINDLDSKDLAALPTFQKTGGSFLAANQIIEIGRRSEVLTSPMSQRGVADGVVAT